MKRRVMGIAVSLVFGLGALCTAADFNGDGGDDVAIYRPGTGMWSVRNVTRLYLGAGGDIPVPVDLAGDGTDRAAVFRPASGLWAISGLTRIYMGVEGDVPIGKGGYNPNTSQYDYVVRPGDADDLARALQSDSYRSVFVPSGIYLVNQIINVDHVRQITGEDAYGSLITFPGELYYLSLEENYCHVEKIRIFGGGSVVGATGAFHVAATNVTLRECRSDQSDGLAFAYTAAADYASFIDCIADGAVHSGFVGPAAVEPTARFFNCAARLCEFYGFLRCYNLSSCYAFGNGVTDYGFGECYNLSSCTAVQCATAGFFESFGLSACRVEGRNSDGFDGCDNISASHASNCLKGFDASRYISSSSFTFCTMGFDASCSSIDEDSCPYWP